MQESGKWSNRKDKTAAWISRRPLISVTAVATVAFLLGISASASEATTEQATIATSQTADSVTDDLEEELETAEEDLQNSQDNVAEIRAEKAGLQRKLSSQTQSLRQTRRSLSVLRTKLNQTRSKLSQVQSVPVAASAPVAQASTSGSGCDPNYSGSCVPNVSYDLDCDDISGSVNVVGSDPHGFDGDGDGSGCE